MLAIGWVVVWDTTGDKDGFILGKGFPPPDDGFAVDGVNLTQIPPPTCFVGSDESRA